jgi:hypothetical protein
MLSFPVGRTAAFDHDDRLQPRPVMAFLKPLDIIDHGCGTDLDTAVIAIDGVWRVTFVSAKSLAFCSVAKSLASSRSDPSLPFSAMT